MAALGEAEAGLELEAMRREDSSWHPCQVSLSSTGFGLDICFESDESEDILVQDEEALACLRFRSVPLLGDDCSHIMQGEHVLAADKSKSKSLFYDAEVEEVLRVRHSKKIYCRCTFVIKWLHRDLNGGTVTVPSGSVMKLATKSINLHPTIDKFLKMIKSTDSPSSSPFSSVFEDLDGELDLNVLLDQQIEQITNSADVSKGIARDILLGVKADIKGQIRSKRNSSHVKGHVHQNNVKRSTRSSSKSLAEKEVKDAPAPQPSIQEKHENISQLSPLAARAALASLMSSTASVTAMNGSKLYNLFTTDEKYVKTKLSSTMSTASSPVVSESLDAPKPQIPTKQGSGVKAQLLEPSSGRSVKEWKTDNITSKLDYSGASSVALSRTTRTTRVTRSTIQKEAEIPTSNVHQNICTEDVTLRGSTIQRRLTRSAVSEKKEISTGNVELGLEEHLSTPITKLNFSEGNLIASYSTLSEKSSISKKKPVPSSLEAEIIISPSKQGKKKQTSHAVETTPQTEGAGISTRSQKRKMVSSHTQEKRFSPRLRDLPRTALIISEARSKFQPSRNSD